MLATSYVALQCVSTCILSPATVCTYVRTYNSVDTDARTHTHSPTYIPTYTQMKSVELVSLEEVTDNFVREEMNTVQTHRECT